MLGADWPIRAMSQATCKHLKLGDELMPCAIMVLANPVFFLPDLMEFDLNKTPDSVGCGCLLDRVFIFFNLLFKCGL